MGGGSVTSGRRTAFGQGKEWLAAMKTFGISAEDGKRIIYRLGNLLLSEHEKLFGSYWRQVFGPPSSLMHLLGKGLSVRARNRPRLVAGLFSLSFITHVYFIISLSLSVHKDMRAPILSPGLE